MKFIFDVYNCYFFLFLRKVKIIEIFYKDDAFEVELAENDARHVLDEKHEANTKRNRERRQRQNNRKRQNKILMEKMEKENSELKEQIDALKTTINTENQTPKDNEKNDITMKGNDEKDKKTKNSKKKYRKYRKYRHKSKTTAK
uniref:BZIP domain-containing protein n=1 Tax=Clytia hemisphaerica TaxID=252671 RepID=A0A7M6DRI7_9CNID